MHTISRHTDTDRLDGCDGHQAVAPPDYRDDEPIPFVVTRVRDRSVTPLSCPFAGAGTERR